MSLLGGEGKEPKLFVRDRMNDRLKLKLCHLEQLGRLCVSESLCASPVSCDSRSIRARICSSLVLFIAPILTHDRFP